MRTERDLSGLFALLALGCLILFPAVYAKAGARNIEHLDRSLAVQTLNVIVKENGLGEGRKARERADILEKVLKRLEAQGRILEKEMTDVEDFRQALLARDINEAEQLSVKLSWLALGLLKTHGF